MDIAQLGFAVDTSALKDGKASLDALVPATEKAEKSSAKLSSTLAKVDATADKLMAAANGLSSAVQKMSDVLDKSGRSATTTAAAQGVLSTAANKVSITFNGVTSAAVGAQTATKGVADASTAATGALNSTGAAAVSTGVKVEQLDAHMTAYRANLRQMKVDAMAAGAGTQQLDAHMIAYRDHLDRVGQGANNAHKAVIQFGGQDSLNAMRQLSDIGVTAAMGMSPFMIAIQQGPQLLDILQNKAATTGQTLGAVFKAAGAQIWIALAPILAIALPLIAVFGVIAAAFGLAAHRISQDAGDVTKSMHLSTNQTKKFHDEVDRLKNKDISVNVTFGDTFQAFFQTIGEGWKGSTDGIASQWKSTLDTMAQYGIDFLKTFYGAIQGTNDAIVATWQELPAAFGDVMIQAANYGIDQLNTFIVWIAGVPDQIMGFFNSLPAFFGKVWESAVNLASEAVNWLEKKIADAINWIIDNWQKLPGVIASAFYSGAEKAIGAISWLVNKVIEGINSLGGHMNKADFGHIDNPFAGTAAKVTAKGIEAYVSGVDKAGKKLDDFGNRWVKNSVKIAQNNLLKQVGPAGSESKTPKRPKTDAAKFEDIVKGANNDIATENARAEATTLTAEAAATLTEKTKLLNEANSKRIALTDGMRSKIDELSAAYGKAKVAADNAIGLKDVLKVAAGDLATLQQQSELIGLVGRQLAYQTEMQKLLNDAKAKGMTADAIAAAKPQMEAAAGKVADQSQANTSGKAYDDQMKSMQEAMANSQAELAAIGLKTRAAAELTMQQKLLNDEVFRGIQYSPQERAALIQAAGDQAVLADQVKKTKDAIDFGRATTKEFFKDFTDGVRNGKSVWESFADAAVGALNKILDKLLDSAFNAALDGLFGKGKGGGGIDGALSGLFTSLFSAKGNVFNSGGHIAQYANGGTFTNSIVDKPTMFASGGALGVMGEAGPEAIMPLKRGGDGSLGVQMHGPGNGGAVINAPITITNDNRVTGAVSSSDIVELQRASAERTKAQLKRDIPGIIQQYQRDGAIV